MTLNSENPVSESIVESFVDKHAAEDNQTVVAELLADADKVDTQIADTAPSAGSKMLISKSSAVKYSFSYDSVTAVEVKTPQKVAALATVQVCQHFLHISN